MLRPTRIPIRVTWTSVCDRTGQDAPQRRRRRRLRAVLLHAPRSRDALLRRLVRATAAVAHEVPREVLDPAADEIDARVAGGVVDGTRHIEWRDGRFALAARANAGAALSLR